MEELMHNPYAWPILSLCTIISVVFSIYTWIMGKKIKELSIDITNNEIINKGINSIPKLDIKYNERSINALTSTSIFIWNSGTEVINNYDVVGELIKIKSNSEEILDSQIMIQSDETNKFVLHNTIAAIIYEIISIKIKDKLHRIIPKKLK